MLGTVPGKKRVLSKRYLKLISTEMLLKSCREGLAVKDACVQSQAAWLAQVQFLSTHAKPDAQSGHASGVCLQRPWCAYSFIIHINSFSLLCNK